ncbi:MAG: hypothetical protein IIU29_00830 [Erysipelotrichaceae bacterium]|nr:hypothetical protein [Erysipelotrichaceae bacterium]
MREKRYSKEITGTSFIFFPEHPEDRRFCFLDDPTMEIMALDPSFRIRRRVHLGSPEKTGYGYQVFIDDGRQSAMMLLYLLLKGERNVLIVHDDHAHAFDLEWMKDINCTYSTVRYYYRKDQFDLRIGYSIHLEDSKMVDSTLIAFRLLDDVLKRHPELKRIKEDAKQPEHDFREYKRRIEDHLRDLMGYTQKEIAEAFEMYREILPRYYLIGYSVPAVATMMYNEL